VSDRNQIEEIKRKLDIVSVVREYVPTLKKMGRNYFGLCPFHNERTPSFSVNEELQIYKCFGCGESGDVISFVEKVEGIDFTRALELTAKRAGVELIRTFDPAREKRRAERERILEANKLATQYYHFMLMEHKSGEAAREYVKTRKLRKQELLKFKIGFAPDGFENLKKFMLKKGFKAEELVRWGLLADKNGHTYDKFRRRLMFPILDHLGDIVGFSGRVLVKDDIPKYLNSPETPVFRKGHELYGLYEARQTPGRPKEIIVVEGYLDVASLVQHGVENVVATLGTATTTENIRRLTRLTDRVMFCFDGDRAGRAAAWRAMETALPYGGGTVELKFLLLPDAEDPDSFVRKHGPEAFRALADQAAPLSDFLVKELAQRVDFDKVDGRARFQAIAKPLLQRLPDGVYRTAVMDAFGEALRIPADLLVELMADEPKGRARSQLPEKGRRRTIVQNAIHLALHYPSAAAHLEPVEGLEGVDQPGVDLLRRVLETARETPQLTTASLLERFRDDPAVRYLDQLVSQTPLDDQDAAPAVLRENLEEIVQRARKHLAAEAVRSHRPGLGE